MNNNELFTQRTEWQYKVKIRFTILYKLKHRIQLGIFHFRGGKGNLLPNEDIYGFHRTRTANWVD